MGKSFEEEYPVKGFGWAARDPSGILYPFKFSRRATGEKDVRFNVLYTGICHSDLHHLKNDWGSSRHEIVDVVTEVGKIENAAATTMHAIIDMVTAFHPFLPLLNLLKNHAKYIMLGAPAKPPEIPVFPILWGRKIVTGSNVGGVNETQEMLNFAAEHGIIADFEVVPIDYVNTALECLAKNDVRYRFVIDVGNTLKAA